MCKYISFGVHLHLSLECTKYEMDEGFKTHNLTSNCTGIQVRFKE